MKALLAGDRRVAEKEVERLLAVEDPEERPAMVRRAYKRYRTPAFVERMVEEARTWLRHDWREALALLAIAESRLPEIRREVYGERLIEGATLRVAAHRANTLRVAGELPEAEKGFEAIRARLAERPLDDPALLGELASLEASLRYDQRRLEVADGLLDEAAERFQEARDGVGLAKVLVQRGMTRYIEGDAEHAIPCYEAAASSVDRRTEPWLVFVIRHNLVLALCAADQAIVARAELKVERQLAADLGDPNTLSLLAWAEGKVAAGLGDEVQALERLRAARDAYAERALAFNAALVDLDLAEVHLGRGETAEVRRLAERMAGVFVRCGVDREAARAVALFHKAALAEAVTLDLIARTRRALLRSSARFGRPSG